MLTKLTVKDYALIESLEVDFTPGLNILTGETGAGKSILIGALGLALGERADIDSVRTGAKAAVVEAEFSVKAHPQAAESLKELEAEHSADPLIIRREVNASTSTSPCSTRSGTWITWTPSGIWNQCGGRCRKPSPNTTRSKNN
jgi:DNA repair protein RecN (Recombination protein N)